MSRSGPPPPLQRPNGSSHGSSVTPAQRRLRFTEVRATGPGDKPKLGQFTEPYAAGILDRREHVHTH